MERVDRNGPERLDWNETTVLEEWNYWTGMEQLDTNETTGKYWNGTTEPEWNCWTGMEQMDCNGMERLEWSNWNDYNRTTGMEQLEWNWNGTTGIE